MISKRGLITFILLLYYSLFFLYVKDPTYFLIASFILFVTLGMLYPKEWFEFMRKMGIYIISIPVIIMILITVAYYLTFETSIAFIVGMALVVLLSFAIAVRSGERLFKYSMFVIGALAFISLLLLLTGSSFTIFYPYGTLVYQTYYTPTQQIPSDVLYNTLKFTIVFWNVTVPALFSYISVLLKGWEKGRSGALAGAGIGLTVATFVVLMGLAGTADKTVFVQIVRLMPFGNTIPDYLFDFLGVIGSAWIVIIMITLVTFVTAGIFAMISRLIAE